MIETAARPEKAWGEQDELASGLCRRGVRLGVEALNEDTLDARDVDEIKGESPSAGAVQTGGSILVPQPDEFLGLAELGPGEVSLEQTGGKSAGVFAEGLGLANATVGVSHGVGGFLLGIEAVVGRALTGRLSGVSLDEFSAVKDSHELGVAPHVYFAANILGGGVVQRV
jgi:hypothetical protein